MESTPEATPQDVSESVSPQPEENTVKLLQVPVGLDSDTPSHYYISPAPFYLMGEVSLEDQFCTKDFKEHSRLTICVGFTAAALEFFERCNIGAKLNYKRVPAMGEGITAVRIPLTYHHGTISDIFLVPRRPGRGGFDAQNAREEEEECAQSSALST